jgi:hypothetical protein
MMLFFPRTLSWLTDAALFLLLLLGLVTIRVFAESLHADAAVLFALALAPIPVALTCLVRLLVRAARLLRTARPLKPDEGSVTIEWLLIFPLFALLFLLITQLALLAAAALAVQHAAFAAARSAIVSLPENDHSAPSLAAALALTPISPSGTSHHPLGQHLQDLSTRQGSPWRFRGGAARFSFADQAARLTFDPPRLTSGPQELRTELTFPFFLALPLANAALAPRVETIAGVRGRFFRIHARATLFSPGARTRMFGFNPGSSMP